MKSNEYEYLLNNIYPQMIPKNQSINADIYLRMQEEYISLNAQSATNFDQNDDFAFRKSFLVVRNYVQQAIKDGMKNFQFSMIKEDFNKLSFMVDMLNPNFFDKKSLDQIILKANSVFNQYNLKN